jgi:hypothetical protein
LNTGSGNAAAIAVAVAPSISKTLQRLVAPDTIRVG